MPLPKISTPLYELQLPSNGKKIKYRPFLVREEKVLILALEGGDNKSITNAVKKILKDCISTRGIKVEELPTFDIEYLFLNIRGKSVGEALDNNEESWAASDCTKKELKEWVQDLNSKQFKELEIFFETMPKLSHTLKVTNPKTKVESEITLEGLASFFG